MIFTKFNKQSEIFLSLKLYIKIILFRLSINYNISIILFYFFIIIKNYKLSLDIYKKK